MLSLPPILWKSGIDSGVMETIAAPFVGRNDHLDDTRSHNGAGVLCNHEGAGTAKRHIAVTAVTVKQPSSRPSRDLRRI